MGLATWEAGWWLAGQRLTGRVLERLARVATWPKETLGFFHKAWKSWGCFDDLPETVGFPGMI